MFGFAWVERDNIDPRIHVVGGCAPYYPSQSLRSAIADTFPRSTAPRRIRGGGYSVHGCTMGYSAWDMCIKRAIRWDIHG